MQIGVLGSFEVRTDDGAVADVPGARLRALLIALALEPGRVLSKATLVDWIWGERPPADATNALHRLVSRLRKVLPEGSVEGQTDGYRLAVAPDAVDAVRFERLVAAGRAGEALALWRGAPMQDVDLPDSAAFGAAVTRLAELRLTALENGPSRAIPELTALVTAHPLRERLAAALMRALAADGRGSEALQVYQRTREALADALGADPSPELSALHVALLRGEQGRDEAGRRESNLRAELTSYVGKDADVAAVRELVAGHRLTTLIGPGGTGKTRLATETARRLLADLPDGAWLVELAPIGADGDLAQATLAALGLRDALLGSAGGDDPTDRLVAAMREREALLVLDNCEHVIEAAATFAHRLLGECRDLRILATSREPLGITGEALWPVEPLRGEPAVQLLLDRAGLTPDSRTLATAERVCRALDGMPLAIELAAARLRTMSIEQLAHRLDNRFRLLTTGSRTALPHHRTLRAVVDWSWELLTDAERAVLRRLAVFAGGASLEAAERVCAGEGVDPDDVLDLLTALTEKSLLRSEGTGGLRYRMLETIKEYAAERLAEANEADLARQAHLAWFTELAETAEPHLRRAEQLDWLAVLAAEHDNIGAAMRGALAAGETAAAIRLAAAAGWYWWLSGRKAEGMELVLAAASLPGEADDRARATAYALAVHFLTDGKADERRAAEWIHKAYRASEGIRPDHPLLGFIGPLERMLTAPEEVVPAFEALLAAPDPWARALARLQVGKMRIVLGSGGREADALLETALAEFRALGERFGIWFSLTELADRIASRGGFAGACELYEQAIAVATELGATEDVIGIRSRQAQLYRLLGDQASSAAAITEAELLAERVAWPDALADLALAKATIARGSGDLDEARRQLRTATDLLGSAADQALIRAVVEDSFGYLADDLDEARRHRAAALAAATEAGHPALIAVALVGVADFALRRDQPEQAARLLAASAAVRGLTDRSHPDVARIERETRSRLGSAEAAHDLAHYAAGWEELAAVTLAS
ncbi:BTAD domain-containing putative transcriptional regulator [Actinoplanes sp. NPDC026619]|uniref:BTAD domain-containing putative transcriptional regulator n=1 Tax=Actinoplanes sp. NPDC026619 TaxID=3155798 RepID=UPI0033D526AA